MGANESLGFQGPIFDQQEWENIPISSFTKLKDPSYGSNFKILVNRVNRKVEVQKYDLVFNSQSEYYAYKEVIDWRIANRYVLAPKHLQDVRENRLCSSFQCASIFFQRTPLRLYEIQDISLEEGLYILYAAAQGFEKLFERFGYFEVESEMICFSREGTVNVWANKNLSKAGPESTKISPNSKTFSEFMSRVLNIIEKLIDFEGKVGISEFIIKKKIKDPFCNLLKTIQLYAKDLVISVPRYLSSVRSLCKKELKGAGREKDSIKRLNSSYGASNKSSICKNYQKGLQINNIYNISIGSVFRRSHQISPGQLTTRKKLSFMVPKSTLRPPLVSFQYCNKGAVPDSPKNYSYSTEEETFRKSKFYSIVDVSQGKVASLQKLGDTSLEIDPEIAADMLRITENTL